MRQGGYTYGKMTTQIRSLMALFFIGYTIVLVTDIAYTYHKFGSKLSFINQIDEPSSQINTKISNPINIAKRVTKILFALANTMQIRHTFAIIGF